MTTTARIYLIGILLAPIIAIGPIHAAQTAAGVCGPSAAGPNPLPNENVDPLCNGTKDGQSNPAVVEPATTSSGISQGSSSSSSQVTYVPYDRLTTGPDGQPCITTGFVQIGSSPSDRAPNPNADQVEGAGGYNNVYAEYPPCPERPRAPGEPTVVETRASVAARYWELVPLPRPQPRIEPGRAITGKPAYLETRGEIAHTYTNDTAFGPLTIVAKGAYTVSWGDGETSGPHADEGKPWPSGQITHQYSKIGTYDILVTEKWTATWSLGGERGVLRTLQTVGRLDDFPVQQIQAVVVR